jgi:hypothetical protein
MTASTVAALAKRLKSYNDSFVATAQNKLNADITVFVGDPAQPVNWQQRVILGRPMPLNSKHDGRRREMVDAVAKKIWNVTSSEALTLWHKDPGGSGFMVHLHLWIFDGLHSADKEYLFLNGIRINSKDVVSTITVKVPKNMFGFV